MGVCRGRMYVISEAEHAKDNQDKIKKTTCGIKTAKIENGT